MRPTPYFLYPYSIEVESPGELEVATEVFGKRVTTHPSSIPAGSLVVPRFRMIPFGRELQDEVESRGSTLVNTYHQHRKIADIFSYCDRLAGHTPECFKIEDIPRLPEGEYFVKGETNSMKNDWFGSAFAPSRRAVLDVVSRLSTSLLAAGQTLVVRPFQKYRQIGEGVDGRPIFHERRVFVYRGQVLSQAFYWSSYPEFKVDALDESKYQSTLTEVLPIVNEIAPFLVVDLAEYPDGSWGVVELNDGCMSGLSDNDPHVLWSNFVKVAQS